MDCEAKQVILPDIILQKQLVLQSVKTVIKAGTASQNHTLLLLPPILDGGWYGLICRDGAHCSWQFSTQVVESTL